MGKEAGQRRYYAHDERVRLVQLGSPSQTGGLLAAPARRSDESALLRNALAGAKPDLLISCLTRTNVISVLAATPLSIPVIVSERNNPDAQRPGRSGPP